MCAMGSHCPDAIGEQPLFSDVRPHKRHGLQLGLRDVLHRSTCTTGSLAELAPHRRSPKHRMHKQRFDSGWIPPHEAPELVRENQVRRRRLDQRNGAYQLASIRPTNEQVTGTHEVILGGDVVIGKGLGFIRTEASTGHRADLEHSVARLQRGVVRHQASAPLELCNDVRQDHCASRANRLLRVAEHARVERRHKSVERNYCIEPQLLQSIGLVQDRRDPPLLVQRRQRQVELLKEADRHPSLAPAARHSPFALKANLVTAKEVQDVASVSNVRARSDDVVLG